MALSTPTPLHPEEGGSVFLRNTRHHNSDCTIFQLLAQLEYADYQRAVWQILNRVTRDQVPERQIWRQIQFLSVIGPAALPPELLDRVSSAAVALCVSETADCVTFRVLRS
jgi:hypothetical protein